MAVVIRELMTGDEARVSELARQLGQAIPISVVRKKLEDYSATDDNQVLVATDVSGNVVGGLQAVIERLIVAPTFAEIRSLVIDENFRGQGIGRELVRYAEQWALTKGAATLRIRARKE